jgi:hypothetical protein
MKSRYLLATLILGLGLTMALLLLLDTPATGLPVAHAVSYTVCPAGPPDCNYSTVQAAVDATSEGDVVKVATGTYTDVNNYGGDAQAVYISKTLTIRGGYISTFSDPPDPEANPTTLDAQGQGRVLHIIGNISPTVEGLNIIGGDTSGNGGGIVVNDEAMLALSHSVVTDNMAGGKGGGVAINNGSSAIITNSKIYANKASFEGGGISANRDSYLNLLRSRVVANVSLDNDAGGINCDYCSSTYIENSIIAGNASARWAGGL